MFLKCILVQKVGFFFKYTGLLHGHKMKISVLIGQKAGCAAGSQDFWKRDKV
jgi:hypothetical protein